MDQTFLINWCRYTAEITPAEIRGRMTSTLNSGIGLGLLVAYWVQYGALNISGNAAWRLCFALQLIPGVVVGAIIFFRPESPRWLFRHDRSEEALQVLANLHANGNRDDAYVQSEYEEIRVVVAFERGVPPPSYFGLIFGKQYRRRTALGMGLQFMQQITGVNIVLYYAAKVFAQTGRTGTSAALLANGISSALLLVSTFSLTVMADKYGRRKPIMIGPVCMGICLIVVGAMLVGFGSPHFDTTTQAVQFTFTNVAAGNAAVAFMLLYMVFFGAFFSALPWIYQNEVFPINARGRGTALATSTNWFVNFWLGLYIPDALNTASWKLYFIFGAINICISVVGFFFFPETCLRSLEELDLLFLPGRRTLVFLDKEACSKGSILEHTLADGATAVALELEKKLVMGAIENRPGDEEKVNVRQEENIRQTA
jgi:sugar porter (SP) family MFS transporter